MSRQPVLRPGAPTDGYSVFLQFIQSPENNGKSPEQLLEEFYVLQQQQSEDSVSGRYAVEFLNVKDDPEVRRKYHPDSPDATCSSAMKARLEMAERRFVGSITRLVDPDGACRTQSYACMLCNARFLSRDYLHQHVCRKHAAEVARQLEAVKDTIFLANYASDQPERKHIVPIQPQLGRISFCGLSLFTFDGPSDIS